MPCSHAEHPYGRVTLRTPVLRRGAGCFLGVGRSDAAINGWAYSPVIGCTIPANGMHGHAKVFLRVPQHVGPFFRDPGAGCSTDSRIRPGVGLASREVRKASDSRVPATPWLRPFLSFRPPHQQFHQTIRRIGVKFPGDCMHAWVGG